MEESVTIDRLEDQLIDHPDASTKQDLSGSSLDETFQKKLNERAEQLSKQSEFQILQVKPELIYNYEDYGSMMKEINDWFCYHDFKVIGLKELPRRYKNRLQDQDEFEYVKQCVSIITSESLDSLTYYILGAFEGLDSENEQIDRIRSNSRDVLSFGLFEMIITFLKQVFPKINQTDEDDYFKGLTIFYFLINFAIYNKDSKYYVQIRETLKETGIIDDIIKIIEKWKIKPDSHSRVRYLILILWKLILIELGDSHMIKQCKEFLNSHHNIEKSTTKKTSPLDYFSFRQDVIDKYPLFYGSFENQLSKNAYDFKQFSKVLDGDLSSDDNSICSDNDFTEDYNYFMAMNDQNSLSKYLSTPRPNKSHTVHSQLPAATIHLSTPVPSPPTTPSEFMAGGEKIRKSYQVNQSMPLIYPNLNGDLPMAIKEAEGILKNSIYDSYTNKRLWDERKKFMAQERGFMNEYKDQEKGEFDYDEELLKKYPNKSIEIRSLIRVEGIYKNNLDRLNNLASVLLDTIKLTKFEKLEFIENQLNGDLKFDHIDGSSISSINKVLIQQLEMLKIREITQMASSSIIILLLKWFKLNHVLKYYYFSSILFDQHICTTIMEVLNKSFNNESFVTDKEEFNQILYQNRLMNPTIRLKNLEFFNNCLNKTVKVTKYQLINTVKLSDFLIKENNESKLKITKFNYNFAFILSNLLNILNKVLIKNYTQRILTLNELKPTELFKMVLNNYDNKFISQPIYKILKKLIPYQGRKWKSMNMDLISLIYLNCDLQMRDNWLSGKDLENDFSNSFDQEISLRGLVQFYNLRLYGDKMVNLGYEIKEMFNLEDEFDYL
ncbi:hypothetical protein CLIB1444_02S10638 [[Candida] jaroonii]|uniref:Uncharacterized protein n=1 Tax=[Candida] jaroonii TaxID=467808 RepID=A0ACA9Y3P2_9ASCO|nr:hypothetical protein CLIB1444_02S10638 [[Candida] jaroonii]